MKGNNELLLNQVTMIAAVQMYLDSLMVNPAPQVTSVARDSDAYGGSESFRVKLADRELSTVSTAAP